MLSYCLKCEEMCVESTLWGICHVGKFVWEFALWGFALWGFALWGFILWGIGREPLMSLSRAIYFFVRIILDGETPCSNNGYLFGLLAFRVYLGCTHTAHTCVTIHLLYKLAKPENMPSPIHSTHLILAA